MYRFFAVIWNESDLRQVAVARQIGHWLLELSNWGVAIRSPGLTVLEAGETETGPQAHLIQEDGGVVLGTLFSSHSAHAMRLLNGTLPHSDSIQIERSRGRHLIDAFWGNYVAFVRSRPEGPIHVVRDPSGILPCYMTNSHGVHLVFSHVHDWLAIEEAPVRISWNRIAALALGAPCQTCETVAEELSEVHAGECVTVYRGTTSSSYYWNPVDIARHRIEDQQYAVSALRETVLSCVRAWASRHSRIVHSLSGGLDSSIVLACLSHAEPRPEVTCLNVFTTYPEGDERLWARAANRRAGFSLLERLLCPGQVRLELAAEALPSVTPPSYALEILHGAFEKELVERLGVTAFFQGAGGDGVFLQNGAQHAPADFVHHHGIRPGLLRLAHDAARITRRSVWSLAWQAVCEGRRPARWEKFTGDYNLAFMSDDVIAAVERSEDSLIHPLLRSAQGVPRGKLWHLSITMSPPPFSRPFLRFDRPAIVFPLLSQPVVELCLRLPTYLMFTGGWDRSIARRAFQHDLPREIVTRRGKGAGDLVVKEIFNANAPFIRESLLDGFLARERIIDPPKLEAYLRERTSDDEFAAHHVLSLWELEMFVRSWHRPVHPAAAKLRSRHAH